MLCVFVVTPSKTRIVYGWHFIRILILQSLNQISSILDGRCERRLIGMLRESFSSLDPRQ